MGDRPEALGAHICGSTLGLRPGPLSMLVPSGSVFKSTADKDPVGSRGQQTIRSPWQTGAMRNLIAVAFVEPVAEGLEFARDDWPLHITLVKFDVAGTEAEDSGREPGGVLVPDDALAGRIAELMDGPVRAALGGTLGVGGEAGFGRSGQVPVSLISPSPELSDLHRALVAMVAALPGRISTPLYTLAGYRPHVSHHGTKRLREGETVSLDRIALVDMSPDGGHATRRILRLWTA